VPLSPSLSTSRLVEVAQYTRERPLLAYGVAAGAVAAATFLRWVIGPYAMQGTPFITYYPAILLATFLGGLWPGILATAASAVLAWFAFIPPQWSLEVGRPEAVSLTLFILVSALNVALVNLLNKAIERVVSHERNIRVLVEAAPNGIVVVDDHGVIKTVNRAAEALFGYDRRELLGQEVELLVPEAQRITHVSERRRYQLDPQPRLMGGGRELSGRRKDGSEVPVEVGLAPVSRNGLSAVLATVVDISERKAAQERQQFLVRELQHRSRNLFAVIQSIAALSIKAEEAKKAFEGRLMAVARAHDMLADAVGSGAPLEEIIKAELSAFSEHLTLSGCELAVNAAAAQQFSLIVHELATNAAKYGALSTPSGHVSIEGRLVRTNGEDILSLLWKESGGPPVKKPLRKGFGSTILLDVAKQFGHHAEMTFDITGVTYELRVPVSAIQAGLAPARPALHG